MSKSSKSTSNNHLKKALLALEKGGIVIFPTETVYGMACTFDSLSGYQRIYQIKQRPENFFLPLMCSNITMAKKIAEINPIQSRFINHFSPGPITYILNKNSYFPDQINTGSKTIAVRIPNYQFILELIEKLNRPLLVTSANLHHQDTPNTFVEIEALFKDKVDYLVPGSCQYQQASTIIDLNTYKIIRPGVISDSDINEYLKKGAKK